MRKKHTVTITLDQLGKLGEKAWREGFDYAKSLAPPKPQDDPILKALAKVNKGKLTLEEAIEELLA
jgi:hypothetical protein